MSADSLCKIVRFVRQNAHEKPELWPFVVKGGKTRYFDLEGEQQVAGYDCQLVFLDRADDKSQVIVGNASIGNLSVSILNGERITTKDKKNAKNSVDINPDLVEFFIYAPGFNKRSALFQARNPTFELPGEYPNLIEEAIVECQCPLYVPTPTTGDSYEKYRAINIDYLEKHVPQINNYVQRVASKWENAMVKLTNIGDEPTIMLQNANTENEYLQLYPKEMRIETTSHRTLYDAKGVIISKTPSYQSSLFADGLTVYDHARVDYVRITPAYFNFINLPFESKFTKNSLSLASSNAMLFIDLSRDNPLLQGTIGGGPAYTLGTVGTRGYLSVYSKSPLMTTTINPTDRSDVGLYIEVNGSATTSNNAIMWHNNTTGKNAYPNWTVRFDNSTDIIEDQFNPEEIHPVRSVIRCHHINGRKAVSNYIQFDDNTEMLIWRRYLDEDCEQINDNSLTDFIKSESYQIILNNRYNKQKGEG